MPISSNNLFDLTGKKALITGGNSGLGLGFARGIARQGGDVILWARNEVRNAAAADDLRQYGGVVKTQVVDVTSEAQVINGMNAAVAEFERLDCVIANAGIIGKAARSITDLDAAGFDELMQVNLYGAFYTLREGARHMVARTARGEPGGSLIACGSLSVFQGLPGLAHYGAAKGALAAIVKSMAVDLGPRGIRVNMIAPGYIKTDLARTSTSQDATQPSEAPHRLVQRTPMGRIGHPRDLEGIAAYFASDASAFHTGDIVVIDGGLLANLL
jgi:NAD(P)-dependent dehydrogenase (short-subunit alcohol dehydrogenase family)